MRTIVAFFCILLVCVFSKIQAQNESSGSSFNEPKHLQDEEHPGWLFGGLGLRSIVPKPYDLSVVFGCARYNKHLVTTIRYVSQNEFALFSNPSEKVWDLGLLFGPALKTKHLLFSISFGISLMGCTRRGEIISSGADWSFSPSEYEKLTYKNVGLPLEAQFFLTPFKHFGFGIYPYADFNKLESFSGLVIRVH